MYPFLKEVVTLSTDSLKHKEGNVKCGTQAYYFGKIQLLELV